MNPSVSLIHEDAAATVLSAGSHLSPVDGACVMEVVSTAAGEPWSDSPSCTHPLLRHLARLVNDAMSDEGRAELLSLVPELARASSTEPEVHARLALACTRRVQAGEPPSLLLTHLSRVSEAELFRERHWRSPDGRPAPVSTRVRRALFERGPAVRAVEASVGRLYQLPEPERDRRLADLLRCGLTAVLDAT